MLPSSQKLFVCGTILMACASWMSAQPASQGQVEILPRLKAPEKKDIVPRADIRIDTNLVLIPVTVTDPMNRFVTGLDKENFKVFEEKKEQVVSQFSSEDAPLSVGVIFDCSGSMGHKLEKSRLAVAQFFKTANPEDEFFLVQFGDTANLILPFTTNLEEIQNRLTFTQSKGQTALAGRDLLGPARNEEGKESAQGAAADFRWRR